MRQLAQSAGRVVASMNTPGSGLTAPCGTIDDNDKWNSSEQ